MRPPGLSDVALWEASASGMSETALREMEIFDGLPLAPVTRADVETALEAAGLGPDDLIGKMPPLSVPAVAASVAICALLAGCEPAQFPVVVAATKAIADAAFNGLGVLTTTGTAAVTTIVSGPVGRTFNSGANLLGPGHRANASVGRAIALTARVIGGALPGLTDMATMGQPGKYTFCFAENESQNPWGPLHADRGVAPEQSAVTVFAASGTVEVTNVHAASADEIVDTLAAALFLPGTLDFDRGLTGGGRCLVLISPDWAAILAADGLSRAETCLRLCSRATWPVSALPPGLRQPLLAARRRDGLPESGAKISAVESPTDILMVVAGGVGTKQTLIPCWAGGSQPVTAVVDSAVAA